MGLLATIAAIVLYMMATTPYSIFGFIPRHSADNVYKTITAESENFTNPALNITNITKIGKAVEVDFNNTNASQSTAYIANKEKNLPTSLQTSGRDTAEKIGNGDLINPGTHEADSSQCLQWKDERIPGAKLYQAVCVSWSNTENVKWVHDDRIRKQVNESDVRVYLPCVPSSISLCKSLDTENIQVGGSTEETTTPSLGRQFHGISSNAPSPDVFP